MTDRFWAPTDTQAPSGSHRENPDLRVGRFLQILSYQIHVTTCQLTVKAAELIALNRGGA